ncbi:hypothetical protein GCM10009843_18020 [Nocardioides bigeumensis]|uniref:Methyltransferase type 11 domain-containing protein n=2 Tax=Nocardioides bigeumensis TaxID=433657 RepID=A0ABN2Y6E5_9ACTN
MLGQLGYWMTTTWLQWSVSLDTDGDPMALGLLYFVTLVPLLVLSPWAGAMADRRNRARIIACSQGVIAVLCAAFVLQIVLLPDLTLPGTFAFAFGIGTMLAVSAPAGQSLVATLVPRTDLTSAIGMQSMSMNVARIAGPSLTGLLLAGSRSSAPVVVYAVAAAVSAWTAWRLPAVARPPMAEAAAPAWRRVLSGVRYVRQHPPCGLALVMLAVTSIFGASYVALLPAIATERLGGGSGTFTALVGATGIGAVLGVLVTSWRDGGIATPWRIGLLMVLLGTGVTLLGALTVPWVSLVVAALTGGVNFAIMTSTNGLLNASADDQHRGRVMSLYVLAWAGLVPVGAVLLAALASATSLRTAFAAAGLLLVLLTFVLLGWHHRATGRWDVPVQAAARAFDAARYSHGHQPAVLSAHGQRTAHDSCAYLLPHLRPGQRVLDVGCGPGSITLDLAALVQPGRVTGLEPTEAPLVEARLRAVARGDSTSQFATGDVYDLPFPAATFDVVHAHQVLQHLEDPVAALREMWRVCKPGGVLAVRDVDYGTMTWSPPDAGVARWHSLYCSMARENGAEPHAGRFLDTWARHADIAHSTATTSVWTYANAASTRWYAARQASRVLDSAFAGHARARGLDLEDLRSLAASWIAWGEADGARLTMTHGELIAVKHPQPVVPLQVTSVVSRFLTSKEGADLGVSQVSRLLTHAGVGALDPMALNLTARVTRTLHEEQLREGSSAPLDRLVDTLALRDDDTKRAILDRALADVGYRLEASGVRPASS